MLAYNVTVKVEPAIEMEWLKWMQQEHIPDVMATGLFTQFRLFKLLEQDEAEGPTYITQYFAPGQTEYKQYINEHAPLLRQRGTEKWGNRFVAFRTVMEVVN
jgi:Domain of unknown function (DUF4286)